MPNFPYFTSGDALTGGFFWVAIKFPTSQGNWIFSQFLAALDNMSQSAAWQTGGETDGDEAAQIFDKISTFWIKDMPWSIGDTKFTAAPPDSGVWLLCDGSAVSQTIYANLYARIGTTFNTGGEPSGTFRVPDMRGRNQVMTNNGSGRLPSWANAPGGSGGESDHTLIISEMPSHSHTNLPHSHGINSFIPTGTAVPPPLDAGFESPIPPGATGPTSISIDSTGGDQPHNNVQPGMAFGCYILADF